MSDEQEADLMKLFSNLDRMMLVLDQHRQRQLEENRSLNMRIMALEKLFSTVIMDKETMNEK
jgi:hypothetical protein